MKCKVTIDEETYEVTFEGYGSVRFFGEIDIEVEEVICLRTGCSVDDTVVTNNDCAMMDLEKCFQDNYEPPGD